MHIKLVAINGRYTHSSPALFHVRNELEAHCPEVTVEICQHTIRDPYYELLLGLCRNRPQGIFFSAAVWNSDRVEELIRDLHGLDPDCLLVVGGPQARVVGDALGQEICTVVEGAAEALEDGFYDDLLRGELAPLYGRSFFHSRNVPFVSPYREEDFSRHLANRNIYYESSRGCPFSCTYCLSSAEKGLVHKELAQVARELDLIMAHRPKVLRFVDRTFNDLPERALALWRLLLDYPGDTLFHFEIAPDRFSEEMFQFVEQLAPGRFQFEIGIQSTHEPTLEAVRRRIDPRVAHATLSRLAAMDTVHLHADLILGLPHETQESFLRSFAEVFAMGPHYIQMGLLKLLPDTEISRQAAAMGYRACHRPPYAVLANQWLEAVRLQHLYWFCECVEKFYNTRYFPSLWRYLRQQGEDIAAFFLQLTALAEEQGLFGLAPTQELLTSLLVRRLAGRDDRALTQELLVYDWLRSGGRSLPPSLAGGQEARTLKDQLYQELPQELPGLYGRRERNRFFRQAVFHRFSAQALQELGFTVPSRHACLVFLKTREKSLLRLQQVSLLPDC